MPIFPATPRNYQTAFILLAAGAGSRAGGGIAKQFQRLGSTAVLNWSLESADAANGVTSVVLVIPKGAPMESFSEIVEAYPSLILTEGGDTRTQSVRQGLAAVNALPEPPDYVLIHDAARPGLNAEIIEQLIGALHHASAAAPCLPVTDAIKKIDVDGKVSSVDRSNLRRVQTPQAFRWDTINTAYESAPNDAVDDIALIETTHSVSLIPGDERLMKITHPEDFKIAERLLVKTLTRIGSGFDVHAFVSGKSSVTLCGIDIPHDRGLEGHSDADVAWHALTDAILGALALGDIGDHFPPSEPKWKGVASEVFLLHAVKLADERGFVVENADLTILCERPKIAPFREEMRRRTAAVLAVEVDAVSVKATTTEGLGFVGRQEGIAAQASVLLVRSR